MSAEASKQVLDGLDLTNDEVNKFKKAFDDPEFRKLFKEYAEELNDPENRKRYEDEIAQMEGERGMDVQFVMPKPGYVLKTSQNGNVKVFINICQNELIGKPAVQKETRGGSVGANWSLPHSFTPPRDDMDKTKAICKVYDVVFHPNTYHMGSKNDRFRSMIEETAMDGIDRQFKVKLDRKNIKRPKMTFKGNPVASVIRTKKPDFEEKLKKHKESDDPLPPFPYPYEEKENGISMQDDQKVATEADKASECPYAVPNHSIKYSSNFDIQNFSTGPGMHNSTRPSHLIVEIELPLIRSAGCVDLDITEYRLKLVVEKPAAYQLDLKLSYPVDETKGSAKFDKTARHLVVTLPIKRDPVEAIFSSNGDDVVETSEQKDEKSLIEVLDSETFNESIETPSSTNEIDQKPTTVGTTTIEYIDDCDLSTVFHTNLQLKYPPVEFRQDNLHLILFLNVKNVAAGSVKLAQSSSQPNMMAISVTTRGEGGWPMHYAIFLGCCSNLAHPEKDSSSRPQVSLSISEDNTVICFEKSYAGFWSMLQYGSSLDSMEEHPLPAVISLATIVEELYCPLEVRSSDSADKMLPHVEELSQNRISIRLVNAGSCQANSSTLTVSQQGVCKNSVHGENTTENDDNDTPLIILETAKGPRPAKGILKPRSISNSSEETPPVSAREELLGSVSSIDFPGQNEEAVEDPLCSSLDSGHFQPPLLRKSVSFSQRQEQALFTPAEPVSALHQTLRNRRKRARRRVKGQRRHSGSGDDLEAVNGAGDVAEKVEDTATSLRRRIHSEGDLDGLIGADPPHPWKEVTSPRGKRVTKFTVAQSDEPSHSVNNEQASIATTPDDGDPGNTEQHGQCGNDTSEGSHLNWSELPGVQQHHQNHLQNTHNPHRTKCAVALSEAVIFDLDED